MESQIEITRYSPNLATLWDEFVLSSRNGTFLFCRGYMDYHADRFLDNSFLFFIKGKPIALLPACIINNEIYSHAGLTYGGLILGDKTKTEDVLEIFRILLLHLKALGIKYFHYKPVPFIYHQIPAEEDLYALFRFNARLSARRISSVINFNAPLPFSTLRKRGVSKALKNNLMVKECDDIDTFFEILEDNLNERYHTRPVHTAVEMNLLKSRFPENIRLFAAYKESVMYGGVVLYITTQCVHTQYISASPDGKACGALDLIFYHILKDIDWSQNYFDFGTSTEGDGSYLNETLIFQKEGFGGRGICYDSYTIVL